MKTTILVAAATIGGCLSFSSAPAPAQTPIDGASLFAANCATCHGPDGRGRSSAEVGFDIPLPDFTDCDFATREPAADWGAIVHEGGPIRAFNRMMPSFGEALSQEEIEAVVSHLQSFCTEPDWPRGELNLPRALFTEKAYPEDEAVVTGNIKTAGDDAYSFTFLWEQRFGTRNQMELSIPVQRVDLGGTDGWITGAGDLAVGVKHVLKHSRENGSILSIGGEYLFAIGDEQRGLGAGSDIFESYLAYGKLLGDSSFVQLQATAEYPIETEFADEYGIRAAFGRTLTFGSPYGRLWTPMLEVTGKREDESGADTEWDIVPQIQISLSQRQHVMVGTGLRVPVTQKADRDTEFVFYLLWDWFDGGVREGW